MKLIKIEIGIPRRVLLQSVDPEKHSLVEGVVSRGRKIASANQPLDEKVLKQMKEHKVRNVWVKEYYSRWVSQREARKRKGKVLKAKDYDIDLGKALLRLSKINTVYELNSFLAKYIKAEITVPLQQKCKNIIRVLYEMQPEVEDFRKKLGAIDDSKMQRKVLKILNQQPETINPRAFPMPCENLGRNYLDYLCRYAEQHYESAGVVLSAGQQAAKQVV